jgi:hypothetical protein
LKIFKNNCLKQNLTTGCDARMGLEDMWGWDGTSHSIRLKSLGWKQTGGPEGNGFDSAWPRLEQDATFAMPCFLSIISQNLIGRRYRYCCRALRQNQMSNYTL